MNRRLNSKGDPQNMLVDHLFQYSFRISPWPKTAEKRGFCTCVTDGHTDGRTNRPSYRDAFLMDASKNGSIRINYLINIRESRFGSSTT